MTRYNLIRNRRQHSRMMMSGGTYRWVENVPEKTDVSVHIPFVAGTIRTHNGFVIIENPKTEGHQILTIRRQPDDFDFAPGRRIVMFKNDDWLNTGFGFVADDGSIQIWKSKRTPETKTYSRMLTEPESYIGRGLVYTFVAYCRHCNDRLETDETRDAGICRKCSNKTEKQK